MSNLENINCKVCGKLMENRSSNYDVCYKCSKRKVNQIIVQTYREAYPDDMYRQKVFDVIEELMEDRNVGPDGFARMLRDRGIEPTKKDANIWNISIDQCNIHKPKLNLPIMVRWREDERINKVLGFLSRI